MVEIAGSIDSNTKTGFWTLVYTATNEVGNTVCKFPYFSDTASVWMARDVLTAMRFGSFQAASSFLRNITQTIPRCYHPVRVMFYELPTFAHKTIWRIPFADSNQPVPPVTTHSCWLMRVNFNTNGVYRFYWVPADVGYPTMAFTSSSVQFTYSLLSRSEHLVNGQIVDPQKCLSSSYMEVKDAARLYRPSHDSIILDEHELPASKPKRYQREITLGNKEE